MSLKFLKRVLPGMATVIVFLLMVAACEDDLNPIPPTPDYRLDIDLYRSAREILTDSSAWISGYLVDSGNDTMYNEPVQFSVSPVGIGNITPTQPTVTDRNTPWGFREWVIFVGRQEGAAVIRAVYKYANGVTAAWDTLSILVKAPENG